MLGSPDPFSPRQWVFNLDAEYELAHGTGYAPSAPVLRRIAPFIPLASPLLGPGDTVFHENQSPGEPSLGRCWSPTPHALRQLKTKGVLRPDAPPLSVLQQANHRKFCLPLGGGAPGAHYLDTQQSVDALRPVLQSVRYLIKRPFGAAGRDMRSMGGGPLEEADLAWLGATLRRGGALAEPLLHIEREYCLHGLLGPHGELTLGQVCTQQIGTQRAWQSSQIETPCRLANCHFAALLSKAEQAAEALHQLGYFGPFGLDAYTYIDAHGRAQFNPLSELNARYSMGFAVGFRHLPHWRSLPGA